MGAVEGPPTTVGGPPVVCCAACGHPSPRGGETLGGGATNLTPQEIIQEKENSWGGQKKACVWQEGDQRGFPIFMDAGAPVVPEDIESNLQDTLCFP
eukprot:CAMPEP_0174366906 /NCGR_PEP_ID=MMETSP0811_2-20130205/83068_1 /TAXON_ID=73025 ORGANISM="Eutreptiella gymnastica-like, Strain CCMP1594" /NCGR_SAMPLE_ID=MMETSP0811_2 /ASSEMBLY_ACC=CAM_ASM_000667 /LENGTH=96 /DNA_ID=CAMNT_0015508921 /DNA_START=406 /DNA_END=697 /DNA_ORIENTATION=-